MGAQVHCEGYLPGYYSMRDLNEDSNSSSWPLFYGDNTLTNGQYCNGFTARIVTDAHPGYDKNVLKQKILEHEAIFKNQVVELHRLYRIQRDMMDEIKRKEHHKLQTSMELSSSSSLLGSQVPSEDARKWHITSFPLVNSGCAIPSTSGTEIFNSPLSSSKGNEQSGRVQIQNGCSSKVCDVLEVRPSKVRKKLFDLQLPADKYIDTDEGEQLRSNGGSFYPSYHANGNHTVAKKSSNEWLLGDGAGAKSNCGKDSSASNSCLRSPIWLADLNEPAQLEEETPSPVDFLSYGNNHKETRGINASSKLNPAFVALPRETTWNSNHASPNGTLNRVYVDSKGKEREWFSPTYETGNIKGSLAPVPQTLEQAKLPTPSHPAQVMLNKAYQPHGIHPIRPMRDDLWKEREMRSLETFHRNREQSNYTRMDPFVSSHVTSPYPYANSSELANSWSKSVSSWGKPSGSFTQRPSSVHTNPLLNSSAVVSKSSQASQSHEIFGDKWHINGNSRLNPGLASDLPIRNAFDHGSSLGSKGSPACFPLVPFDSLNRAKVANLTSERFSNNGFEKFHSSSNNMDSMSEKGFNLNVLSNSSLNEELSRPDVDLVEEKREPEDSVPMLPWLRARKSGWNKGTDTTKEVGETLSIRKILGVPILENSSASRNESSLLVSTSTTLRSSCEGESSRHERRNMTIDINMACDLSTIEPEKPAAIEPFVVEKVMETKANNVRTYFDLNSCIIEDEDPFSVESKTVNVKTVVEIDLEAPVLDTVQHNMLGEDAKQHKDSLQFSEHKPEQGQDEVSRIAAEAIVAISSSSQFIRLDETCSNPSDDPSESLRWFVDVVFSCEGEPESKFVKETVVKNGVIVGHSNSEEIDDFEAMTLQLTETKEEDYMPKPFVPEFQKVEDAAATSVTNRTRKGHARRGRPRRDFQRDILPGLTSLSRHEVTEDLQTFGGLMRATGHPWNSGLTRRTGTRNGGARGRRTVIETTPATVSTPMSPPLLHQHNNIEASLVDKSLTGWGKTTRRPRRQRCPAGNNPPTVPLT